LPKNAGPSEEQHRGKSVRIPTSYLAIPIPSPPQDSLKIHRAQNPRPIEAPPLPRPLKYGPKVPALVHDAPAVHVGDKLAAGAARRLLQRRVARAHDGLAQVVEAVRDVPRRVVPVVGVVREPVRGDARARELARRRRAQVGGADECLQGEDVCEYWR